MAELNNFEGQDPGSLIFDAAFAAIEDFGVEIQRELDDGVGLDGIIRELADQLARAGEAPNPHPEVPKEATGIPPLVLHWRTFGDEFKAAGRYATTWRQAQESGKGMTVDPNQARECSYCSQRWLTLMHYLLAPNPPSHLSCALCLKRIPVGQDIWQIPKRRAQPNTVDMNGDALELGGDILNGEVDTRQQCTAEECPLKAAVPHKVGLYSRPGSYPASGIPLRYTLSKDGDGRTQFWGGNSTIPSQIHHWTTIVSQEEWAYASRFYGNVKAFRERYSREATDKMRAGINAFRAYHCFYQPLSSRFQQDIIPSYLRLHPVGSKPWVDRFIQSLARVEVQDLAADDRQCALCKGVYEEEVSGNGIAPELAVKLPKCGHVFGEECLGISLLKKDEGGWGMHRCGVCRVEVYQIGATQGTRQAEATDVAALDLGFQV